ncbi:MAG TPA: hypothetical protein VK966_12925 [Longimicrobiales bacterium]|nr:hypothetical protein [Longimicrobiales bacterium]
MTDLRKDADEFTIRLREALGERLRSVVLHGSVARGESVPDVSDVNLMVLADTVDPGLLRQLAPLAREWLEAERALPLVLSWDEWQASRDAFAIETADMLDSREVLHGDDPLAGAVVDPADLRLQAERELRGKLVHLREGTLFAADRPKELGNLLVKALPAVATYLRTALRLADRPVPGTTPEAFRDGATLVGAEADALLELWEDRRRGRPPRTDVEDRRTGAVYAVLERTVDYVDTLTGDQTR